MVLVLLLTGLPAMAAPDPSDPRLRAFWENWQRDVGPLISPDELGALRSLENDRQREFFLDSFWQARGNPALERWRANRSDETLLRRRSLAERRLLLLFGKPSELVEFQSCEGRNRPVQVWRWDSWQSREQGGSGDQPLYAVLVERTRLDPRSYEVWEPGNLESLGLGGSGRSSDSFIETVRLGNCFSLQEMDVLRQGLSRGLSEADLKAAMPWPPGRPGWLDEFIRDLSGGAARPAARLEVTYPGSFSGQTILRGRVSIDPDRIRQIGGGMLWDRVTAVGDIFSGQRLVDSFEINHHLVGAQPADRVTIDLYRRLRPGTYVLEVRIADRYGLALLRDRRPLTVPRMTEPAPEPAGSATGYRRLTRDEVVVVDTLPSVEVLPVRVAGGTRQRVEAVTTGGPISAVSFSLDGRPIGVDSEAPYGIEVEVTTDRALLVATANDPAGRELARDERWLFGEARPLGIRLGALERSSGFVPVELSLPRGESLSALECFHGRKLTARLVSGPWQCPIPASSGFALDYLRASATLENGESVEDVIFLGTNALEEIDVRLIELFVSVLDDHGRPVTDLGIGDFRVVDGGTSPPLIRAEKLENLALNVAVLMDVSASMGRRTRLAAASAERFFADMLRPEDRASLLAFNHDLYGLVPFTSEAERLRHGAEGLRGSGSTRLNDGIVWALGQYAGLDNRRALIVLSDGTDVDSDFPLDQVMAAAIRAGVAVYPVSIVHQDEVALEALEGLARETGGRAFKVISIDELERVYREIELELRSQYVLVYQPTAPTGSLEFRRVEVEVVHPGMRTLSVQGYYP